MASADLAHAGQKTKIDPKTGRSRLQCVVVTPEKTLFDEVVEFVALPLFDGELGVLPGRSPLIGRLGFGELRTTTGGATRRYFLDGGFAQVRDNVVTVLTNRAIPAEQIDATAANAELERAKSRHASGEIEQAEKTKAVSRARALVHTGTRRG